jgi:hypothetical protein
MTATKIDILEIVIGGMADRIPPINPDSNPVAYGEMKDQYIGDIFDRHYTTDALKAGMRILRFQHKPRGWPTFATLMEFLEEGRKETTTRAIGPPVDKVDPWKWSSEVMKRHGRRAAEVGVAFDLSLWAERNPGQEPDESVFSALRSAQGRLAAKMLDVEANPDEYRDSGALRSLYGAMQQKWARVNAENGA